MPATHQIDADGLARPDEVAQCLLLSARNPNRMQLAGITDETLVELAVGDAPPGVAPGDLTV